MDRRLARNAEGTTRSAAADATTDPDLRHYLAEAASWDADRVAQQARTARIAWWTAGGGWLCAVTATAALVLLMPLKRVDPFVIRVDTSTGLIDVVPQHTPTGNVEEVITRYLLTHYVTICERFNFATAESDYQECGAFHTPQRNQAWYEQWKTTNPGSPLNVHKDGSTVRAHVKSVSFFQRANGVNDLAHVRYVKAQRPAGGGEEKRSHWIATLQYAYAEPSKDAKTRSWNPLGFKVLGFTPEPEVSAEDAAPTASFTGRTP